MPFYTQLPIHGQLVFVPGTRAYLAPEIRENGEASISKSSDIWALGCIGYELCLGRKLAGNRDLLKQHVANGKKDPRPLNELIESIPPRFSVDVRSIIKACLAWDPKGRCTAIDLRGYLLNLPKN